MNAMTKLIDRHASGRLLGLLAAVALGFVLLFQMRGAALKELCSAAAEAKPPLVDCKVPDARLFTSPKELRAFFDHIGAEGRTLYWRTQISLDLVFPLLYTLIVLLFVAWSAKKWRAATSEREQSPGVPRWFLVVSLLLLTSDLLENIATVILARGHGAVPDGVALWAAIMTTLKWILALGVFGGAGALVTRRIRRSAQDVASPRGLGHRMRAFLGGVGRVCRYGILLRVPAIFGAILLFLPALSFATSTVRGLMIMEGWGGLAVATFLALLLAGSVGYAGTLSWCLGASRTGAGDEGWQRELRGVKVTLPFLLLSLPFLLMLLHYSTGSSGDLGGAEAAFGLAVGFACAGVLGWLIERARRRFTTGKKKTQALAFIDRIARFLGPGYFDSREGRIEPGHALSLVGAIAIAAVYTMGYLLLRDTPESVPAIAYVLIWLILLNLIFSGLAFFLDRFRIPLLLALVVYSLALSWVSSDDHVFDATMVERARQPRIESALETRRARYRGANQGRKLPVTVVCASGGGIQASAWTARVLTGLQEELGESFTQSIQLISATSGGSLGTYYFLSAFDPELGAPPSKRLKAIVEASTASSLEATVWGLAYPDFMRGLFPMAVRNHIDRGWAMECAWRRHGERLSLPGATNRLSDWMDGAKEGFLPGVMLNGTFVGDAQQFIASNLNLSDLDAGDSSVDTGLSRHYGEGALDMPAVTAARLSATFPWVTPVARARFPAVDQSQPIGTRKDCRCRIADGGYFDNQGVVGAVQWLRHVLQASNQKGATLSAIDRVLLVEIRAFPPSPTGNEQCGSADGWLGQFAAPIRTLVGVRTSSQVVRSRLELELMQQMTLDQPVAFKHLIFQPRADPAEPPLSWNMSSRDKQRIQKDWKHEKDSEEKITAELRAWFSR